MKASLFLSFREIRRRPRGFIALSAVSAALLTILIMMLLYMNASWRADVMPIKPGNYNFSIQGLDDLTKYYISEEPWVLDTYNDVRYDEKGDKVIYNSFRVRVLWSENVRALQYAREIFDRYDLWTSEPYARSFESFYQSKLREIQKSYYGVPIDTMLPHGVTIHQDAMSQAKTKLLLERVNNTSYSRRVINTYIIRPEFFAMISMFALFLCGAMVILVSERYRTRMAEFGSLRSFGLKKRQLWYICAIDNLLASLASIPLGILSAWAVVRLYSLIFSSTLADDSVFLKLEENLPIAAVMIVALVMMVASLAGCLLVCYLYRDRTVMQLIKKDGSVRVSYVAKTSPRFERAKSFAIYPKLAHRRTLFSFILSTAIIVIMMPLPFYYFGVASISLFSSNPNLSTRGEGFYYIFQAIVMLITAMIVIYISSRSSTELRHGELGILRSLGMNKRMIRKTVLPKALKQILYTSVPAVLLYLRLTDTSQFSRTSAVNRKVDIILSDFLPTFGTQVLGVILLVTPPILIGAAMSLRRFHRRSVIANIRENE